MRLKMTLIVVLSAAAVLLIAGYLLLRSQDYNRYRGVIETAVKNATGRQLVIRGDLALLVSLKPKLVVSDITLANAPWGEHPLMARIGRFEARIKLLPLVLGDLDITEIELNDAELNLETDASGRANWTLDPARTSRTDFWFINRLMLNHLSLQRLAVTHRDGRTGLTARYDLDALELTRSPAAESLSVKLAGRLNGQPAALSGQTGAVGKLFFQERFPVALQGEIAGAETTLRGDIGKILSLRDLDLEVQAKGADLALLGTEIGVRLPKTDRFDLSAHLGGSADALTVTNVSGSTWRGTHQFQLKGEIGNLNTLADMDLAFQSDGVNLAELGPIIGQALPQTEAFRVSGRLIGSTGALRIEETAAAFSRGGLKLSADGNISDISAGRGLDLMLNCSGTDLAELGPIIGTSLPNSGPFGISGRLTGAFDALNLENADAKLSGAGFELAAKGAVGNLNALTGIRLQADVAGSDLAAFGRFFRISLPESDSFDIVGRLSGSRQALALQDAKANAGRGSLAVRFTGSVGNLIDFSGVDVGLQASGRDLAELAPLIGKPLPRTGPFSIDGRLKGDTHVLAFSGGQGTVGRGSIKVSAKGAVKNALTLEGIDLMLAASGKDLSELGSMIGVKLPETGPFDATGRLTGSAGKLALREARGNIGKGPLRLAASGKFEDLLDLNGIDLSLEVSGKKLGELEEIFDAQMPALGPYNLRGQLTGSRKVLDFKNVSATVDQSDFSGWGTVEMHSRPKVTLRLESARIDVTPLIGEANEEIQRVASEKRHPKLYVASDHPLPIDKLNTLDADVELRARNIRARDTDLELGHLFFRIEQGSLSADKLEVTYRQTKISADLDVKTEIGSPPTVAVKFLAQDFDLGSFLDEIQVGSGETSGHIDIAAKLSSRGESFRSLQANLDGTISAVFGKGNYPRGLDLIAEDLTRRLIPFWGRHNEAGQLNCGVLQFGIRSGVATTENFLFDSERSVLTGAGEINLATEKIDFLLAPQPKDPSLFSLNMKLRITGSVLDPTVRPDPMSAAIKGAKALSFFAIGPAGLLAPFVSLGGTKKHPCDLKSLQNGIEAIYH
jgi:uncharacterized protein involved in outer membrane biogenesis